MILHFKLSLEFVSGGQIIMQHVRLCVARCVDGQHIIKRNEHQYTHLLHTHIALVYLFLSTHVKQNYSGQLYHGYHHHILLTCVQMIVFWTTLICMGIFAQVKYFLHA